MTIKLLINRTDRKRGTIFEASDAEAHRLIAAGKAVPVFAGDRSGRIPESAALEPREAAVPPNARKRRKRT